ncbi:MAG: SIS domain-containing protein [Methanobacteriota archaeon]|nr:MAG: SIS domain-containing protein [Euryarchaeota archaeon]
MTIFEESSKYILKEIEKALTQDHKDQVEEVINLLLKAEKIFVYGVGRSGLTAKAFAIRLVQLGLTVYFIGDIATPIVDDKSLVLVVSSTGETMSAIQTANICRRVGADVVVITGKSTSKLAHAGNIVFPLKTEMSEKSKKLAPLGTLFEDAAMILLDGIIAELMVRMGQDDKKMRSRHSIWV